jgi:hypothetical protein
MPNDAKLGLVVGVGLVIGVAMVYFRKDLGPVEAPAEPASVTPVSTTRSTPANPPRATYRPIRAKPVTQMEEEGSVLVEQKRQVQMLPPFINPGQPIEN